jgi:hypothetical protein
LPVYLTPQSDEVIPTKRITAPGWDDDPESPNYEYVEILTFLRQEVIDGARKAGGKQVRQAGRVSDELDMPRYLAHLFERQVKGWRLLDLAGAEIAYSQEHLLQLPWAVQGWLHDELFKCGGSVATRDLVLETEAGRRLDYKSPDERLGPRDGQDEHDPLGDAAVRALGPRHRAARSG